MYIVFEYWTLNIEQAPQATFFYGETKSKAI